MPSAIGERTLFIAVSYTHLDVDKRQTKSLATHPATTTHKLFEADVQAELGVTAGLFRLSVGIEDIDDFLEAVKHALDKAK